MDQSGTNSTSSQYNLDSTAQKCDSDFPLRKTGMLNVYNLKYTFYFNIQFFPIYIFLKIMSLFISTINKL